MGGEKKPNRCKDQEDLPKEDLKDLKKLEKTKMILQVTSTVTLLETT